MTMLNYTQIMEKSRHRWNTSENEKRGKNAPRVHRPASSDGEREMMFTYFPQRGLCTHTLLQSTEFQDFKRHTWWLLLPRGVNKHTIFRALSWQNVLSRSRQFLINGLQVCFDPKQSHRRWRRIWNRNQCICSKAIDRIAY